MLNVEVMSKYLKIPIELCKFLKEMFQLIEVRAAVCKEYGIEYKINIKEQGHNRPHIHASYGEYNISITIDDTVEIIAGNLPKTKNKYATKFVKQHLNEFRTQWNKYHVNSILPMTRSTLHSDKIKK